MNRFEFDQNGNLLHFINDELRATVPAAGIAEYRKTYPDAPAKAPKAE
jgi:hypothetical protein